MSVVTKKGDGGQTSLFKKKLGKAVRVDKDSQIIKTIGVVDEANSYSGVIVAECRNVKLRGEVVSIQTNLFTIGAILAGSDLEFNQSLIGEIEKKINKIEGKLPLQKNFVLPGGTPTAAHLMYVRTLVRRAERELTTLRRKPVFTLPPAVFIYLNRLSDYLFILARKENFDKKKKETFWKV
jgi:cob(I)alamin adenosyltransferase